MVKDEDEQTLIDVQINNFWLSLSY